MSQRLKVLISAYACEPDKGSEPEVGWQWALQMARFHDVTVLTRANNRPSIQEAVARLHGRQPLPEFVYHDRSPPFLELKRRTRAVKAYYVLWQRSAHEVVAQLHQNHRYDLMHHVTFAGFRYPIAVWGHGVPTVWGPIGGIESIPIQLLPWHHPVSLAYEGLRSFNNLLQATPFHVLPKRARATTLILASTYQMQQVFARLGFTAELMPTIGLKPGELPYRPHRPCEGPLKLLFVGNIITLKGVDLALEALARSQTDATLTLIGSGNYEAAARRMVRRFGLGGRVSFLGRRSRPEVLQAYADYDVFLFPSLHDTGGYAVIEAMFNELPVVCLDCGGPAVAVRAGCGTKVPLGSRADVVSGLASAVRSYACNRETVLVQGRAARDAILRHYDWDRKGQEMNECYQHAMNQQRSRSNPAAAGSRYAGMGGLTTLMHHFVSIKGLAASAVGLLLIGTLGFLSVGHLKTQARRIVSDTLPGLSCAGKANASLAQAFNRTLLLLAADTPEQQARLEKDIESFSQAATRYLIAYKNQIYTSDDQALFDRLVQRRTEYRAVRDRTIALVKSNRPREAIVLSKAELLPAYNLYREAGDKLFDYNIREGRTRGQNIMTVCTVTQFVVAGIGILIFILGFLIGLFK
jgi:glycosyltransferase involved in cell wall biosynthesis